MNPKYTPQQNFFDNVEEQYVKNGGIENMEKELDKIIENYPELKNEKENLLSILKTKYCQGFLDGYLKVIQ
jgi:hypothetical protein